MMKYCEMCGKEVSAKIVTRNEIYAVCGEQVEVEAQLLICEECGEELFCEELDHETLVSAYNEYRRRHKLLFPDEIREIREQYGLSQRSFARLLNWGDKTVHRYENGALQDRVHNSLLVFLREPDNMQTYLANNEVVLNERQKERLQNTVSRLQKGLQRKEDARLINRMISGEPSIENGFREFDYDKMCAMVLYFACSSEDLLKVKLLKLLNYADMIYYKENGISMSGARYIHLPYGPVPQNYDIILGLMAADHIVHIDVTFDHGYEKHQVIPEAGMPEEELTESETDVLCRVQKRFADFGSSEISAYSHQEKGYLATRQGEVIPYSYAKDICLEA